MTKKYMRYYNPEFKLEIYYPKKWEPIEGFADSLVSIQSPRTGKKDPFREFAQLMVVDFLDPALDILEEFSQRAVSNLGDEFEGFEIVRPLTDATLSGFPAKTFTYHHINNQLELISTSIWTVQEYRAYIVSTSAMRDELTEYQETFKKMIDSFKILEIGPHPALEPFKNKA